jgi:hypothetical protein
MKEYTDNRRGTAPVVALTPRATTGGLPLQVFCLR